jgi:heme A synthase
MEWIYRATLLIAGLINLLPALLAFFPERIPGSYGIDVPDANYELLLRHRAVFFGIIGGLMIYSSVVKRHTKMATAVGLISMTSFIILYVSIGKGINPELRMVMMIDVVATIILCIGLASFKLKPKKPDQ